MKHPIISKETQEKVTEILESGKLSDFRGSPGEYYLGGKYVKALEQAFCDKFNVKYAVSMNSATACLHVALIACGVGQGDEVIVSPYSFSSSASCVLMVGAKPVFVDIDKDDFGIRADFIEWTIHKNTKAIIPVHLMGLSCRMDAITDIAHNYNLKIIEDAAQAIGAKVGDTYVGTIGDCGIFSFNQSKQISSGEGGMLITNNDDIAKIARALRNHAEVSADMKIVGFNYRMCEVEACIALDQFNHLDENMAYRTRLANYMTERLKEIPGLTPPVVKPGCTHSWYTYGVKYDKKVIGMHRNEFQKKMAERGVYFGSGYVRPLYLLPIYEQFGYKKGLCPVAERMHEEELMVFDWLRPPATTKDVDYATEVAKEVISGC